MQSMKSDGLILPGAVIDRVIFDCSLAGNIVSAAGGLIVS